MTGIPHLEDQPPAPARTLVANGEPLMPEGERLKAKKEHAAQPVLDIPTPPAYESHGAAKRKGRAPGSTKWAAANEARMPWPSGGMRPEDALRSRASFLE